MPAKKIAKKALKKPVKKPLKPSTKAKGTKVFTAEERAAMREYVEETKAAARRGTPDDEGTVLAKIAEMAPADAAMGERIHKIIRAAVPELTSRLWYGMPAYAKDGNVVCFFQPAYKFKTRYGTLGFSDKAKLDEGNMWPNSYAITELTSVEEEKIVALLKSAVS